MRIRTPLIAAILAAPLLAFAHAGHALAPSSFFEGFAHPFTGADHLAAMLAVGLWSGLTRTQRRWLAPLSFAATLLAGALLAPAGASMTEPGIAASLLVLGLLVAARAPLPALFGAALCAAFAWMHGAAHGAELQGGAALAGMVAATVLLLAGGVAAGLALRGRSRWPGTLIGSGVALLGAAAFIA